MNANTFAGFINGTKRGQLASLAVPNATELAALVNTDTGTTAAVLSIPLQTTILGTSNGLGPNVNSAILVPTGGLLGATSDFNSSSFDGHAFKVRIAGTAVVAAVASQTLAINLRLGTTIAGTLLAGPTAIAVAAGGNFNFLVEATLLWDSVSQSVTGLFDSTIAGTGAGLVTLSNNGSAIVSPAGLTFVASAKLGVAGTATVNFTEFALEQV